MHPAGRIATQHSLPGETVQASGQRAHRTPRVLPISTPNSFQRLLRLPEPTQAISTALGTFGHSQAAVIPPTPLQTHSSSTFDRGLIEVLCTCT